MFEIIIKNYVEKLTEEDIKKHAKKNNIDINDEECKILYLYAKNYWKEFYKGEPKELISELKDKLRPNTFNTLYKIYKDAKSKINQ